MYGLRKIRKDGKNDYNDFVWPLEVGAEVEAPDWNPELLMCSLPRVTGSWDLLYGDCWGVFEIEEKDIILINNYIWKVRKCKIVFLSENPEGMLQFFDHEKFDSETAYNWAYHIGNQDIMIDKIVESEWACRWAVNIGNKDIMINRITESRWAYFWARRLGDRDIMIDRITDSTMAFLWTKFIGDKDIMIKKFPEMSVSEETQPTYMLWKYEYEKEYEQNYT